MESEPDRFAYAQWVLERNLHWVSAAEVKTGVVVTLAVAMLGALAAAFTYHSVVSHSDFANFSSLVAAACLGLSLFCAAMSVLPRTKGPPTSFVFFGKVAASTRADYRDSFQRATSPDLLKDLLDQIHRNAEIACDKFRWVRCAMGWAFASIAPWVTAIACLVRG